MKNLLRMIAETFRRPWSKTTDMPEPDKNLNEPSKTCSPEEKLLNTGYTYRSDLFGFYINDCKVFTVEENGTLSEFKPKEKETSFTPINKDRLMDLGFQYYPLYTTKKMKPGYIKSIKPQKLWIFVCETTDGFFNVELVVKNTENRISLYEIDDMENLIELIEGLSI